MGGRQRVTGERRVRLGDQEQPCGATDSSSLPEPATLALERRHLWGTGK